MLIPFQLLNTETDEWTHRAVQCDISTKSVDAAVKNN